MATSLRIALKIVAAYLIACLPSLFVATASGPHGAVWSLPEAVVVATWLHWAFIGRVLAGNSDGLPFALAFVVIFSVGLFFVWFTERGRRSQPTTHDA